MSQRIEARLYGPETRSRWPDGPWNQEPDQIEWMDDDTGYKCVIRRNDFGSLCGYVAVPSTHPAHGINAADFGDKLYCHWGITWSDYQDPIKNIDDDGVSDLWWFGFDCSHAYDITPALLQFMGNAGLPDPFQKLIGMFEDSLPKVCNYERRVAEYRTVSYVEGQIQNLIQQLVAYATLVTITVEADKEE